MTLGQPRGHQPAPGCSSRRGVSADHRAHTASACPCPEADLAPPQAAPLAPGPGVQAPAETILPGRCRDNTWPNPRRENAGSVGAPFSGPRSPEALSWGLSQPWGLTGPPHSCSAPTTQYQALTTLWPPRCPQRPPESGPLLIWTTR